MRRIVALAVAALAALLAGAAAAGTPGVTASSVLLGGTAPLSGEAAAAAGVAAGANAYFQYVDARGGVYGRRITYKVVDDAYDPSKTVEAVRGLVQQDNVFAIFNSLGTAPNLAVRDFLNSSQVPQLFVAAGAHTFGADYKRYPWTIGFIPSYVTEGTVYGRYLAQTRPGAKIAVLYQDDDYGKDLLSGLQTGLGAKAGNIVAKVGYDPTGTDVSSQVSQLQQSGADTLAIFAFGKFAIQAYNYADKLGWHPQTVVNDVAAASSVMRLSPIAATKGAISIAFGKDPTDPSLAKDPGVALYRTIMARWCKGCNAGDPYYMAGMASAFTMVDVLQKAGKNLTRDGVQKAISAIRETNNPFVLPGIVVSTTPTQHFPITQVQLQIWGPKGWKRFGPLVQAAG